MLDTPRAMRLAHQKKQADKQINRGLMVVGTLLVVVSVIAWNVIADYGDKLRMQHQREQIVSILDSIN